MATTLCGCQDNIAPDGGGDWGNIDITVPTGDYITFWTDVKSRAALVQTDYLEQNFGVYCYKYDFGNTWNTYKVTGKPSKVLDANKENPYEVTYKNGSYDYGEPVMWEGYRYAFFAYSPYGHECITGKSDETTENTPYLIYKLDTETGDTSKMVDIMTGFAADQYAAASKDVTFRMYHRLAAVDVAAVNYYDYSYDSGSKDDKGNPIYNTEKITIEIESLTAKLVNLKYGQAKIYLDRNVPTEGTALAAGTTPTYTIVPDSVGYELMPTKGTEFDYISEKKSNVMLLIPQTDDVNNAADDLKIEVVVNYKKKRPDDTYLQTVVETVEEEKDGVTIKKEYKVDVPNGSDTTDIDPNPDAKGTIGVIGPVFTTTQIATFNQSLIEGYRYYALLTFTSHAVSINIVTSAAWTENKIYHEFD